MDLSLPSHPDRTPEGHDLDLLREMLSLSPAERILRNVRWVTMIERMRAGLAEGILALERMKESKEPEPGD